ncbi:Tat proofreading chaperone FdhE [Volucribacter psittacicida]|uniref:Protein FdhE homolog n=1 Tax=Volucribacter psittacicida TaxID=203482 RepID=A0A4R1FJY2_9PAST|nr:formate dehydrogenase accessory protein FdhE [Volucribacter psittacicida]TCJ94763.1 Tat proofreading chaperone FdhE [Volucribacter psittacicida]
MSIKILPESEIVKKTGQIKAPLLLFANPKNLYQRRAERLRKLAIDSPFADYLLFAATLVDAQLKVLQQKPIYAESVNIQQLSTEHPLDVNKWQRDPIWRELLMAILAELKISHQNQQILSTIEWLEKASNTELEQMADHLLAANYAQVEADKAVFIWAALSLYWLQLTQFLSSHQAKAENADGLHLCPVCHSSPTASVVHFGSAQGLRYLHCALCESEWNMVRVKCTNCGDMKDLSYWSIDNEFAPVKAESCDHCHSYMKILYQEKDPHVEAIADDLASLFLDSEMEQKGFLRNAINPFLFPGE